MQYYAYDLRTTGNLYIYISQVTIIQDQKRFTIAIYEKVFSTAQVNSNQNFICLIKEEEFYPFYLFVICLSMHLFIYSFN